MDKGGRPTPERAGLVLANRPVLWERLQVLPEGTVFHLDAITEGLDEAAKTDLEAMIGYDLVPVHKNWYTAIREGRYVRLLPNAEKVVESWCGLHDWGTPTLFGDWWAHRNGLYPWEPIAGYRFRVTAPGANTTLTLGHMRLRIVSCPAWLEGTEPHIQVARALCDMPHKTLAGDIHKWLQGGENGQRRLWLTQALAHLQSVQEGDWETAHPDARGWKPLEVARYVGTLVR